MSPEQVVITAGAAEGFVRVSFSAGEEMLAEACRSIASFVAALE